MKKVKWSDLIIFIVSAELVGVVSALLSRGYSDFFDSLTKPPLSPPAALFPIVWAVLYALMGWSAYLIYSNEHDPNRSKALIIYAVQLAVNFSWSIIFFRFQNLGAAAFTAVLLSILVALMVIVFRKVNRKAALLNIPYLFWSLFASYLAIANFILNTQK